MSNDTNTSRGGRPRSRRRGAPSAPLESAREEIGREKGGDPPLALSDELHLGLAEIADPHLDDLRHIRNPMVNIVEDRRVRPGEALVGVAEVGVRIEMEDAEPGARRRARLDRAERRRVIAADDAEDLPERKPTIRLAPHERVHPRADFIDLRRGRFVGFGEGPTRADHRRRRFLGFRVPALHRRRLGEHGDPRFVGIARLRIRIDPPGDSPRGSPRGARRAAAIGGRRLEGHRQEHHPRLRGAEGQTKDSRARRRRRVRVEGGFLGVRLHRARRFLYFAASTHALVRVTRSFGRPWLSWSLAAATASIFFSVSSPSTIWPKAV